MVTHSPDGGHKPSQYAVEIHVRGVIHIQIERMPPALIAVMTSAGTAVLGWLTAHVVH